MELKAVEFDWVVKDLLELCSSKKAVVLASPDFEFKSQTIGMSLKFDPEKSQDHFFYWVENRTFQDSHFLQLGSSLIGENGKTGGHLFSNSNVILRAGEPYWGAININGGRYKKSLLQTHSLANSQHRFRCYARLTNQDSENESLLARQSSLSTDFEKEWSDRKFCDATLVSVQ